MAKLTSRGFTADQAADFVERSRESHAVQWRASSVRYVGGNRITLAEDLPIVAGSLTLDSSDPHRRQLTLEVGGTDEFVAANPDDPLVPFGQVLVLSCRIQLRGGEWSRWLKQGEYPIRRYTYERPSLICTVEAQDYSATVDEYAHVARTGYGKRSLASAVVRMVNDALPDKLVADRHIAAAAKGGPSTGAYVGTYFAEAGTGRWEAATQLAAIKGYECFFDAEGDLVLRWDVTDDDAEVIPGVGPDIGTVRYPVATIEDGPRGNLVAMTATVTREGAANGVFVNVNSTVDRKIKGKNGKTTTVSEDVHRTARATVNSGVVAWGDRFGRIPVVIDQPVKKITADVMAAQTRRAQRLLHRRRGVIRYVDLDAVGLYWLEPDDRIVLRYAGLREDHYVQRVEFDLTGRRPVRIRTRQLAVTDPGPGA